MNQDPKKHHQSIEGNKNRSMQGDYNFNVQGDRNVINYLQQFFGGSNYNTSEPLKRERSQKILLDFVKNEVRVRLEHSLHNQIYIILNKYQNPSEVCSLWEFELKTGKKLGTNLPSDTTIYNVFDRADIGRKLLILGKPGSGKTTELLKLAEKLVERAEQDNNISIPVLLNLSSWKDVNQSIQTWIIEQLKTKIWCAKKHW